MSCAAHCSRPLPSAGDVRDALSKGGDFSKVVHSDVSGESSLKGGESA
jgi:hypothetical protein